MVNTKIIGNKIAEARKKLFISQAQLAERLFISPQAVGKWERGESMPDITTFNRLADILGVDLNYFSENFQSEDTETAPVDTSVEQSAKGSEKHPERPNRNMTPGNYAGTDFSGADLTGSSFKSSDMRGANFDNADLTDCSFSTLDLTDASFNRSILVRSQFSKSMLFGTKFTSVNLTDVKFTIADLRKTIFENCIFSGVNFTRSDLRGLCLDRQTFVGVTFDNTALNDATFNGSTLKNVSFRAPYAVTNKFYRSLQTISFDGAMMDKLTYATLKGLGVELSKVTTIEG